MILKRLILAICSAAALTCTASAVNALPVGSTGQSFFVSTSLSDTAGQQADPTIYNIGGRTYFKLRDLGKLLDFGVTYDAAANAVHIEPADSYVPEPGESPVIQNNAATVANAVSTRQTIYLSGSRISPAMFNIGGYFDTLEKFMREMSEKDFMAQACHGMYRYFTDADELLDYLEGYSPSQESWRKLKNTD